MPRTSIIPPSNKVVTQKNKKKFNLPNQNSVNNEKDLIITNESYKVNNDKPNQFTIETSYFPVKFPYKPYDCQLKYISHMAEAIYNNKHCVLESPTGTGKTMCLLSTAFAYQYYISNKLKEIVDTKSLAEMDTDEIFRNMETDNWISSINENKNKMRIPKIWYTSRTHTQLKQVIEEAKKTVYCCLAKENKFVITSTVLASRDHLCVHKHARKNQGYDLELLCRKAILNRSCFYFKNSNTKLFNTNFFNELHDVDELKNIGRKETANSHVFCPFFTARENYKKCSIIFLPYVYLINDEMRSSLDINLKEDIVIIDEAHNIESNAEEATSFDLDLSSIELIRQYLPNLERIIEVLSDEGKQTTQKFNPADLQILLIDFNTWCSKVTNQFSVISLKKMSNNSFNTLYEIIKYDEFSIMFCIDIIEAFIEPLKSMQSFLELYSLDKNISQNEVSLITQVARSIFALRFILKLLSNPLIKESKERFLTVVKEVTSTRTSINASEKQTNRVISFWSFAAHVAMQYLFKLCKSVIITSGTLKPIEALCLQIGNGKQKFIKLENTHVIRQNNLFCSIIGSGPTNKEIELTYKNVSQGYDIIDEIGLIIVDIVMTMQNGGCLIFFPSYDRLTKMLIRWKATGIYRLLANRTNIFIESNDSAKTALDINTYIQCVNNSNGIINKDTSILKAYDPTKSGIFFAPYRGKISEGLSLSDHLVRCVVCVGIPSPSAFDLRVELKQKILQEAPYIISNQKFDGITWYNRQAALAVNQAIGRIVRHATDYGAVILLDKRYSARWRFNDLPIWIQDNIKNSFGRNDINWVDAKSKLSEFVRLITNNNSSKTKYNVADVVTSIDNNLNTEQVLKSRKTVFKRDTVITNNNIRQHKMAQKHMRKNYDILDLMKNNQSNSEKNRRNFDSQIMNSTTTNKLSTNNYLDKIKKYNYIEFNEENYDYLLNNLTDID